MTSRTDKPGIARLQLVFVGALCVVALLAARGPYGGFSTGQTRRVPGLGERTAIEVGLLVLRTVTAMLAGWLLGSIVASLLSLLKPGRNHTYKLVQQPDRTRQRGQQGHLEKLGQFGQLGEATSQPTSEEARLFGPSWLQRIVRQAAGGTLAITMLTGTASAATRSPEHGTARTVLAPVASILSNQHGSAQFAGDVTTGQRWPVLPLTDAVAEIPANPISPSASFNASSNISSKASPAISPSTSPRVIKATSATSSGPLATTNSSTPTGSMTPSSVSRVQETSTSTSPSTSRATSIPGRVTSDGAPIKQGPTQSTAQPFSTPPATVDSDAETDAILRPTSPVIQHSSAKPNRPAANELTRAATNPSTADPGGHQQSGESLHLVEPGESFWSIAEKLVIEQHPKASDHEIAEYWIRLQAVNTDRLPAPGVPDLLFPGTELLLPKIVL